MALEYASGALPLVTGALREVAGGAFADEPGPVKYLPPVVGRELLAEEVRAEEAEVDLVDDEPRAEEEGVGRWGLVEAILRFLTAGGEDAEVDCVPADPPDAL